MSFKGQSAVEYLVTYGWMFVALGIAGGIAYQNVDRSCSGSFTGFYSDTISAESYGVNANQEFVITIKNQRFENITVQNFSLSFKDATQYNDSYNLEIPPGEIKQLNLSGYKSTSYCSEIRIRVDIDKGPLKSQKLVADLDAPIDKN